MSRRIAIAALLLALAAHGCAPSLAADVAPTPVSSSLGIAVGSVAPDFTLKTLDGGEVRLSDYKGRPVFINFWASWCVPCQQEMPEIVEAYQAHKDAGLEVLAIDNTQLDILDDVRDFVARFDMSFPVLLDESGDAIAAYRVFGLPTSVFIDAEGIVRGVNAGPLTGEKIEEFLALILPTA